MNTLITHFNACRTRTENDQTTLCELRQVIASKQEAISHVKAEIARFKEQETEKKQKREEAERQRKEQEQKLKSNYNSAVSLKTELEDLAVRSVSYMKTEHEMRTKLDELKIRLTRVEETEQKLLSAVQDLRQPIAVDARAITELTNVAALTKEKLKARIDAFDMTALVAEVQTIEQQRKERTLMSEELVQKSELLSALDVENETLETRLSGLQNEHSSIEKERKEAAQVMSENNNILADVASRKTSVQNELDSLSVGLNDFDMQVVCVRREQVEVENKIATTSPELHEKMKECEKVEADLRKLQEDYENKKLEAAAELEKVELEYQQEICALSEELKECRKRVEEAKAEVERMKELEHFALEYEELSRECTETKSKLPQMKKEREQLWKKVEEKRDRLNEEKSKLEVLRVDADTKRLEMEKNFEEVNAEIEGMKTSILSFETEAIELQNKKFELEGEVHLLKHQLSIKAEELKVTKENFCRLREAEEASALAKEVKSFTQKSLKQGREKGNLKQRNSGPQQLQQGHPTIVTQHLKRNFSKNKSWKQAGKLPVKSEDSQDVSKSSESFVMSSEDDSFEYVRKRSRKKRRDTLSNVKVTKEKRARQKEVIPIKAESPPSKSIQQNEFALDVNKDTSQHNTNTLASTLAEEFSNVSYKPDLDDSITKIDEDTDLFATKDYQPASPVLKNMSENVTPPRRKGDGGILFEPSELLTSTPLNVKRQYAVNPTPAKSSYRGAAPELSKHGSQTLTSQGMPPMRMRSRDSTTKTTRRGKGRAKPRKK